MVPARRSDSYLCLRPALLLTSCRPHVLDPACVMFRVREVLNTVMILKQLLVCILPVENTRELPLLWPAAEAPPARSYVYEPPLPTLPGNAIPFAIALTGTRPLLLNGLYRKEMMLLQVASMLRSATDILNPRSLLDMARGTP